MADDTPIKSVPLPTVIPETLFRALANSTRIAVLRRLAEGGALCVNDFAALTRRNQDAVSRHLRILLRAGAVVRVPAADGDGRKQCYALHPSALRAGPSGRELDFGTCVVRLS